jgi:hypothetical protein
MNKWVWIAIGAVLLASAQCAARTSHEDQQAQARLQYVKERKEKEKKNAERMIRNTQSQTERKQRVRTQEKFEQQELKEEAAKRKVYEQEVRKFTSLTQDLALPVYTDRPITDIIQEAQLSLQKITQYNPKTANLFQAQLERALRMGKHPMSPDGKKVYPNAQIIAQQSVQSLLDYTQHAQQIVEETACQAQETACSMQETLEKHRAQMDALMAQINQSERRFQAIDAQLTKLNDTIKKGEIEITQKQTEAVNLAQCIDTFTTASSKLSQDRITQTEGLVRSLEEKAHTAEQHTTILLLRLQEAEKALRSVEGVIQTKRNQIARN